MPETDFDFDGLEQRFVEAKDFAEFWNYFLDNYAGNPAFMQLGGPAETEGVEVLVAYIAGKIYGRAVEPEGMRLAKIEGPGVVHGACRIEGNITCFLYFENIEKGLVAATRDDGQTNYARFTWKFGPGREAPEARDATLGPSGLPN